MNGDCFIYWIIFIATLFLSSPTAAQEKSYRYTVEEVEDMYLNDNTQFITDPDTIMHLSYRDSINDKLQYMQTQLNTEARLVILPCIDSRQPDVFSQSLFDTWVLEKPNSSSLGLLFFAIIGEEGNFLYMVVGDRMEKILKEDDIILTQLVTMIPTFREKGIGASLYAGIKECIRILETNNGSTPPLRKVTPFYQQTWVYISLALVTIALFIFFKFRKIN